MAAVDRESYQHLLECQIPDIEQSRTARGTILFRYIAANEQPDHDLLCTFDKRFLKEIEALSVQVLCIARQAKAQIVARAAKRDAREKANDYEGSATVARPGVTIAPS